MIGKLNRRIKVKKPASVVIDGAGGVSNGTIEVDFETWASVDDKTSAWLLQQGMQHLGNTYEVIIRHSSDRVIDTTNIIEYEGNDLLIKSVREQTEAKKRYLVLMCYEQMPAQTIT